MNKGFIGVTDNTWAEFIKNNSIEKVNFWCKKQSFKAIQPGDIFFFLKKNNNEEKKMKLERKVIGYGIFEKFERIDIDEAWNKYGIGNGFNYKYEFKEKINNMYGIDTDYVKIGSIILDKVVMFEEAVYLSKLNIEFSNSIVSGKTINIKEVEKILSSITIEYKEDYDIINYFEEGNKIEKLIKTRKRSSNIRRLKIEQFKKYNNGRVFCEVCGEDDKAVLDVHHDKIKVSDMNEGHKTRLEDLRIVCANCHRKIHAYNLMVNDLIKQTKK